jgi:hypothetical protein
MKKMQEGFKTAQVSVGSTATVIVASEDGRDEVTIQNLGTTPVYLGDANVTTINGFPLPGVAGASVTIPATTAIYGRTASGSQTVAVLSTS